MNKESPQTSLWLAVLAILCCGIPLLLIISGGSILALIGGYLTGNNILFILALILAFVFVFLILRRKNL